MSYDDVNTDKATSDQTRMTGALGQACECLIGVPGGPWRSDKCCLEGREAEHMGERDLGSGGPAQERHRAAQLRLCHAQPRAAVWGVYLPPARPALRVGSLLLLCSQPSIHKFQKLSTAGNHPQVEWYWVLLVLESGEFCWLNTE